MRLTVLLSGSFVVLAAAIAAVQQDRPDFTQPSPALNGLVAQLRSPDAAQRDAARRLILAQRLMLLHELQWTVLRGYKKPEQREVVALAIRLLAELRAEESVPTLVEALGFDDLNRFATAGPYAVAPQLRALREIGLPSLDPLVKKVTESADPVVPERAALIIYGVLGKDMAMFYLEDRVRRQKEPVKKERLVQLKHQIQRLAERRMVSSSAIQPPPVLWEQDSKRGRN